MKLTGGQGGTQATRSGRPPRARRKPVCTNVNARRLGLGIQEVFFEPVRALVKFGQPLFDAAVVGAAVQESRLAYSSPCLPRKPWR